MPPGTRRRPPRPRQKPGKLEFWTPPEIWTGKPVFIVGGGPSLLDFDFNKLKGQRIVAINLAFSKLPFAQFAFFADNRFWGWHTDALMRFEHHVVSTATTVKPPHPHFKRLKRNYDQTKWFSTDREEVIGKDSGVQAINLAYHLGGDPLILLGFDMGFRQLTPEEKTDRRIANLTEPHVPSTAKQRPKKSQETHLSHWYKEHPIPSREQNYITRFLPQYSQVAKIIRAQGRELYLGTPSAIDCIPTINVDEFLGAKDGNSMGHDPGQAGIQIGQLRSGAASDGLQGAADRQPVAKAAEAG